MRLTVRALTVRALGLLALTLALSAGHAQANLIFTIQEVGSDVVMTGDGTFDIVGSPFASAPPAPSGLAPNAGFIVGVPAAFDTYILPITGPANFGPGTSGFLATSASGDYFGIGFTSGSGIFVPTGYVAGPLTGSVTFAGQTLASLGVTPGSYTWQTETGDLVKLNVIAPSPVPEPASLTLLGLGAMVVAGYARRRNSGGTP